jgi:hypothetical protein
VQIVLKCGNLNLLEPSGPVQVCNGIALPSPLPLYTYVYICVCVCLCLYLFRPVNQLQAPVVGRMARPLDGKVYDTDVLVCSVHRMTFMVRLWLLSLPYKLYNFQQTSHITTHTWTVRKVSERSK